MTAPMLIMRASGGLSNRIQAVVAGVAYCLLTGRALVVDWRDGMYSDDFSNVFPLWFHLRGLPTACLEDTLARVCYNADAVYPPFWRDRLTETVAVEYLFNNDHLSPENVAHTSLNFQDLERPESILVGWGWDMRPVLALTPLLRERLPRFSDESDRGIVRRILLEHIPFAPDLAAEANAFAARYFLPKRMVGLHIRHTDLRSPLDRLLRTLDSVLTQEDGLFLATDNKHVENMVRRLYPHVAVLPKAYPIADTPLHSHVPGLSNVRKGREALLDMLLLARCQHIIHYRRSSFARIPALLSFLPEAYIHIVH